MQKTRVRRASSAPGSASSTCAAPGHALTHHAILALAEPFSRVGLHVDLGASDRMQREVAFRPIEHPPIGRMPALVERLRLDCKAPGRFRLTRTLATASATARLDLDGVSPAALLRAMQSVHAARQLLIGDGYVVARHDRAHIASSTIPDASLPLRPVAATVRVGTAALHFSFPHVAGLSAALHLSAPRAQHDALPDDVLAVLGWDWSPLRLDDGRWRGSVRLRGRDLDDAATRVMRTAARHLARALAEGPRRFRERLAMRRIGVALRRALPTIAFALMGIEALFAHPLGLARWSAPSLLMVALPLSLLALYVLRSQDPRFELPRWPR